MSFVWAAVIVIASLILSWLICTWGSRHRQRLWEQHCRRWGKDPEQEARRFGEPWRTGRLRAHRQQQQDDWDGPLSRADIVAILTAASDRYQEGQRAAGRQPLTLNQWSRALAEGREP